MVDAMTDGNDKKLIQEAAKLSQFGKGKPDLLPGEALRPAVGAPVKGAIPPKTVSKGRTTTDKELRGLLKQRTQEAQKAATEAAKVDKLREKDLQKSIYQSFTEGGGSALGDIKRSVSNNHYMLMQTDRKYREKYNKEQERKKEQR
jgi:hypothetical protein